jgi:hypothetical protein
MRLFGQRAMPLNPPSARPGRKVIMERKARARDRKRFKVLR